MRDAAPIIQKFAPLLTIKSEDPYHVSIAVWLQGKPANTRRSYYRVLKDVATFTGKHFKEITPFDIARWKEHLKQKGNSDSTIEQRMSAVSSYYTFIQKPRASGEPLHKINPANGVERSDLSVNQYERARKISAEQFQNILSIIDTTKPKGARDKAAFLFYVLCARRRNEVSSLYGRDIRQEENTVTYRAKLKGGKTRWKELPPPVWEAIRHYLYISNRKLEHDSPIFKATVDNGRYLQKHHQILKLGNEETITGEALNQALKRYAKQAEIDPKKISLHSLRHLGAELFLEASNDIHETQLFLDHAHLNTTQIYLSQLKGEKHRHWQGMVNKLKI